jgi:hypothetical protein
MKNRDLKKLALLGLASGMVLAQDIQAADSKDNSKELTAQLKAGLISNQEYTEKELLGELNADGKRMYNELSPEGKQIALKTAGNVCSGQNECKGLNACKTDDHACAGQGKCKGQGKCVIADKNTAVKLVYNKMVGKRAAANGN